MYNLELCWSFNNNYCRRAASIIYSLHLDSCQILSSYITSFIFNVEIRRLACIAAFTMQASCKLCYLIYSVFCIFCISITKNRSKCVQPILANFVNSAKVFMFLNLKHSKFTKQSRVSGSILYPYLEFCMALGRSWRRRRSESQMNRSLLHLPPWANTK